MAFGEEFVETYKQMKVTKRTISLYHCNLNNDHTITNFITFYYIADGNVNAQTTGHSWLVVNKYCDKQFPIKISQRLLDDNGMKSQTRVPLSGNTILQQKRYKHPERSYESGTQNIRTRFAADLRANASIRHPNLNCFTKSDRKIMVNVKVACIEFVCDIKKNGMQNFINHLNKIFNEEPTYTTDGKQEENTDAFIEQLRKADENETKRLDDKLKKHLDSYIQGKEGYNEHLNDLDLCQRSILDDFSYGQNFKISMKKRKVDLCPQSPTLKMTVVFNERALDVD